MSTTIDRIANGFVVYTPHYTYSMSKTQAYTYEGVQTGVNQEFFPTLESAMAKIREIYKAYAIPAIDGYVCPRCHLPGWPSAIQGNMCTVCANATGAKAP